MYRALPSLALMISAAFAAPPEDRLATLYSNRLLFDRSGQPLVTVRLQRGRTSLWVEGVGGLRWRLRSGDAREVSTPPGRRWRITLEGVTPGERRYWPVMERFSAADPARTAAALSRWRDKGYAVQAFESGVTLGLGRLTLDTRTVSIGVNPVAGRQAALRAAAALPGGTGRVFEDWVRRPSGWVVARSDDGLELRARDLLSIEAEGAGQTVAVGGVPWRKSGVGVRRFGGRLDLLIGADGKLLLLETAPAEELLEGTVPSEMFPRAPGEALRAQAVAARGQLIARLGTRHRGEPFHVCSSTHCQVYRGQTHPSAGATAAVRATRGEVLIDEGGLTESVYGSACGGHTEAFHLLWGGAPDSALRGTPDGQARVAPQREAEVVQFIDHPPQAWCSETGRRSGVFRWQVRRAGSDVSARIARRADIGPVRAIRVLKRGRSGRALAVAYEGTKGRHEVRGEHRNRKLLGGLKSGLWYARREGGAADGEPEAWVFRGGGFGHGVGMCQHGAVGLARAGRRYRDILAHYYRGARLTRLW